MTVTNSSFLFIAINQVDNNEPMMFSEHAHSERLSLFNNDGDT